jgi:hypothetical protein
MNERPLDEPLIANDHHSDPVVVSDRNPGYPEPYPMERERPHCLQYHDDIEAFNKMLASRNYNRGITTLISGLKDHAERKHYRECVRPEFLARSKGYQ